MHGPQRSNTSGFVDDREFHAALAAADLMGEQMSNNMESMSELHLSDGDERCQ